MAVWKLETKVELTAFDFPVQEDKTYFHELVKECFDELKSVSARWHTLYMVRGEPMKYTDFFEVDGTDVIAISQKAANSLQSFTNYAIELLPIETDAGIYYALNVLNFIDCLKKEESEYIATNNGIIVEYSLLEFDEEKIKGNAIFKIPEMPYQVFISDEIESKCEIDLLQGLSFDPESNLVWYPE